MLVGRRTLALAHALALTRPATSAGSSTGDEHVPLKLPRGDALVEYLATAEATVKRVYCEMPNYEVSDRRRQKPIGAPATCTPGFPRGKVIVGAALKHGLESLHEHAHLTAGIPVKPMLAKPTKGISEARDCISSRRSPAR